MKRNRIFLCLLLMTVFFINIGSSSVALPFNENQTPTTISINPLRGEPGVYLTNNNLLAKNSYEISSPDLSNKDSITDASFNNNFIRNLNKSDFFRFYLNIT